MIKHSRIKSLIKSNNLMKVRNFLFLNCQNSITVILIQKLIKYFRFFYSSNYHKGFVFDFRKTVLVNNFTGFLKAFFPRNYLEFEKITYTIRYLMCFIFCKISTFCYWLKNPFWIKKTNVFADHKRLTNIVHQWKTNIYGNYGEFFLYRLYITY